jgi:uncharacterized RDD family membrane protein YckC/lipoprotein signal peptidase
VHPTPKKDRGRDGGSLRVFKQFSWLHVGSGRVAFSRPTHQRVTLTVSPSFPKHNYTKEIHNMETATTNEVQYVGFWKRVLAAVTDSYFFSLISILLVLLIYRAEYIKYIENLTNSIGAIFQSPTNLFVLAQITNASYSPLESTIYFWLPAFSTIILWITKSATPGLMAIPAQVVDVRTGQKPSTWRFIIRYVASVLFSYLLGFDYLWISLNKKKRALHDVVSGTAVIHNSSQVKSGEWTKPVKRTLIKYFLVFTIALVVNYGLETLLFDVNAQATPLLFGINLQSAFHKSSYSLLFELIAFCILFGLFVLPPLFFRFSQRWLDEWWLIATAIFFAGGTSNILERVIAGGVRNIFSVDNGFRYICIICGLRFESYIFNPADFFVSIGFCSMIVILLASRFWLIGKSIQKEEVKMAKTG